MTGWRTLVTATDTDVGKTIFSAALCAASGAAYWKPVQSGGDELDSATVARLSGAEVLPETYRFSQPLSPHRAAELDEIAIDIDALGVPDHDGPLVIEGAGGVLVPLTRQILYAELFAVWQHPVVLCARTTLGTINHSLLSIEALRNRDIPILGIAFIGGENADNERTICEMGGVKRLGRLPPMGQFDRDMLRDTFLANFDLNDFTGASV